MTAADADHRASATTAPRALRDPRLLAARLSAVRTEPRVRVLNDWVADLRERLGGGEVVPWLITLLPRLEVVVPMGRNAQAGWQAYVERYAPDLHTMPAWHPNPRGLASKPAARPEILRTLTGVARLLRRP